MLDQLPINIFGDWINEEDCYSMALDVAGAIGPEELVYSAMDEGNSSEIGPSSVFLSDPGFTTKPPTYRTFPCANDSETYGGMCISGLKVTGRHLTCSACQRSGRGRYGGTHGLNNSWSSGTPITYPEYDCPNKDRYKCLEKDRGRGPPASKSTGPLRSLCAMAHCCEEHLDGSNDE